MLAELRDGTIPEGCAPSEASALTTYIRFASSCTDAPAAYHLAGGLAVAAGALGSQVWLDYGPGRLYPNLWIVLVGRSSLDRKSTAIRIARNELGRVANGHLLPTEFSREKLEERVQTHGCGIMFWFEMANALRSLEREGSYLAGVKEMLAEWYDGDPYTRETKGYTIRCEATPLTILAGTTLDWWEATTRRSDLGGGFLPRWCVFYCERKGESKPFPEAPAPQARQEVERAFKELGAQQGSLTLSKPARTLYEDWYRQAEARVLAAETGIHAFWSRLSTSALKLAGLHALSCYRKEIREPDIEFGKNLSRWLMESARYLLARIATDREQQDVRIVLDILARAFPDVVAKSSLLREARFSARRLDCALSTLLQREDMDVQRIPPSGKGRPTMAYRFRGGSP